MIQIFDCRLEPRRILDDSEIEVAPHTKQPAPTSVASVRRAAARMVMIDKKPDTFRSVVGSGGSTYSTATILFRKLGLVPLFRCPESRESPESVVFPDSRSIFRVPNAVVLGYFVLVFGCIIFGGKPSRTAMPEIVGSLLRFVFFWIGVAPRLGIGVHARLTARAYPSDSGVHNMKIGDGFYGLASDALFVGGRNY